MPLIVVSHQIFITDLKNKNLYQIKSAQKLTDQVYAVVEKMGHKKTEAGYMDLHMDAIKNPDKAGSMK